MIRIVTMGNKRIIKDGEGTITGYKRCEKTVNIPNRTICKCGNVDYYCADMSFHDPLPKEKSWKKSKNVREKFKENFKNIDQYVWPFPVK